MVALKFPTKDSLTYSDVGSFVKKLPVQQAVVREMLVVRQIVLRFRRCHVPRVM